MKKTLRERSLKRESPSTLKYQWLSSLFLKNEEWMDGVTTSCNGCDDVQEKVQELQYSLYRVSVLTCLLPHLRKADTDCY